MENLPLEKLVLPFIVPGILLIAWFVRLEMRVFYLGKDNAELKEENKSLQKQITDHKEKPDIHFNREVTRQVDEKNSMRFQKIETELQEIKNDIKALLRKN